MASLSSPAVKFPERLESTLAAPRREDASHNVSRAKSLSASGKRPFLRSWDAMASAVTGHLGGRCISTCKLVDGLLRLTTRVGKVD